MEATAIQSDFRALMCAPTPRECACAAFPSAFMHVIGCERRLTLLDSNVFPVQSVTWPVGVGAVVGVPKVSPVHVAANWLGLVPRQPQTVGDQMIVWKVRRSRCDRHSHALLRCALALAWASTQSVHFKGSAAARTTCNICGVYSPL